MGVTESDVTINYYSNDNLIPLTSDLHFTMQVVVMIIRPFPTGGGEIPYLASNASMYECTYTTGSTSITNKQVHL